MNEAEIEHPIRFVEDKDLDLGQGDGAAVDQIEQTTGRGNEDVDAGGKPTLLRRQAAHRRTRRPWRAELGGHRSGSCRRSGWRARGSGSISVRGSRRDGGAPGWAARRCRIGSAKAAVLPVPVWAMPHRSRPASMNGMACDWIGVGVT